MLLEASHFDRRKMRFWGLDMPETFSCGGLKEKGWTTQGRRGGERLQTPRYGRNWQKLHHRTVNAYKALNDCQCINWSRGTLETTK